ncbi:putative E3 ubiquitin-protein ligase [Echria macrotheca]|uniref:HECT-type E3 ubiquitin transferase n=1 Tax=Echria macrotheca TaxID=438768 RepID=A0AAJ0BNA4_9PEZI|nr:putative E3 ubiquitin-protein ligase [Echria macrotheca]
MAPWPDRVDSQQRAADGAALRQQTTTTTTTGRRAHTTSASASDRYSSATRIEEFDVLDSYQIQAGSSSDSDEGLHPHRPRRPQHNRSMSHPFPSLFSSKKKKSGHMGGPAKPDSDSDDEYAPRHAKPPSRGHKHVPSSGGRDYSTGKCMTCGSLVRWPRELRVFKCTICLTINNLDRPDDRDARQDRPRAPAGISEQRARSEGRRAESPQAGSSRRAPERPISLEHTKALVAQCLRAFLTPALSGRGRKGSVNHRAAMGNLSKRSPSGGRIAASSSSTPTAGFGFERPALPMRLTGPPEPYNFSKPLRNQNPGSRSQSTSYPDERPELHDIRTHDVNPGRSTEPPDSDQEGRRIFLPLEDYIVECFSSFESLNLSFATHHPVHRTTPSRDGRRAKPEPRREPPPPSPQPDYGFVDLDPKLLLLGDFAENGAWWTGGQEEAAPGRTMSARGDVRSIVSTRNPHIDWAAVEEWYTTVLEAARSWPDIYNELVGADPTLAASPIVLEEIEAQILVGQEHAHKTLLKACEMIMKRPGRPIASANDLRFLLIISANPLLHSYYKPYVGDFEHLDGASPVQGSPKPRGTGPVSGRHSGIIKRIVGLLSNSSAECHSHLVQWFARYPESGFVRFKEMVSGFLAYRLLRQNEKKHEIKVDVTDGLIPSMGAGRSPATLHAALGHAPGSGKKQKEKQKKIVYQHDWQIKAAAQVLAFLFAANNSGHGHREAGRPDGVGPNNRERVRAPGQIVATSDFYMPLLDDSDLVADFEEWERRKGRFSFCQYPFLLSVGAKIQILEYDARRQMENRAREAFFDSLTSHRLIQQHLILHVRRDCLVDDSLKGVSEVIGGGAEDIKKGLKIIFKGEEGVDAGGLRKEWFLLLVREVFNPDYGMFIYDEDSQYCYFNPNSLEPSEQFFLVGVVFGLAIHNSTILDVALPPFAFRKLLMAAPPSAAPTSQPRQTMTYTLDDLAEYRPRLAQGLRQLLEFDGDVEETFCLDFVVETNRYGVSEKTALCPGGERRAVTNNNRKEYVDLYVRHVLDTSVTRQFEPFKRGFFTVCSGNALSLFRPEEIELLVRGSDEALDIKSLRAVAEYDNWKTPNPGETEPTVRWFWESFERASPADQRKLLLFITGSDRIPAMGAASLTIRLSCLGEDVGRYPTARTCFNTLALWRYATRERLEGMLWTAVYESEGFGLK